MPAIDDREILRAGQITKRSTKSVATARMGFLPESPSATMHSNVTTGLHQTMKIWKMNNRPILRTLVVSHAWKISPSSSRAKNVRCRARNKPSKTPSNVQPMVTSANGSPNAAISSCFTRCRKNEPTHLLQRPMRIPILRSHLCVSRKDGADIRGKQACIHDLKVLIHAAGTINQN